MTRSPLTVVAGRPRTNLCSFKQPAALLLQKDHTRSLWSMPITLPFRGVFVASAAAVTCFACLLTLLKSVLRSECGGAGGGSSLPAVSVACIVAAAVSLVSIAAYLLKSRALCWALAAAICSKWQPAYFVFATVQRLVLRAMVMHTATSYTGESGACSEYGTVVHAISWAWLCAISTSALSTMCCDVEAALSPALRRCAYGFLALALLLDAIGSVVWGNPLASDAAISFANVVVVLDSQLTSCIISQVVIALHWLYVSCRSRHGRGWAYASLRFELDERGMLLSMSTLPPTTNWRKDSGGTSSAATPMLASEEPAPAESPRAVAAATGVVSRLHVRWLGFQQRQVSRCRVFVIPCVAVRGGFAVARPAFAMNWLRPLQRLADAHPRCYIAFLLCFLGVPSIAFFIIFRDQSGARGVSNLVLNFLMCIMMLGFLSSKRYGLDQVATKHVVPSFRFAIIVALLAIEVALSARRVYTLGRHPTEVVALALVGMLFCLCILLDCSPHLPPSVQIFISVGAHIVAYQRVCLLNASAGRMVDTQRLFHSFGISACFGWRGYKHRLLHRSRSVQDLRCDSAAFPLLQLVHADDASARIAGACARHEQLRERVGEALAHARRGSSLLQLHVHALRVASRAAGFALRIR